MSVGLDAEFVDDRVSPVKSAAWVVSALGQRVAWLTVDGSKCRGYVGASAETVLLAGARPDVVTGVMQYSAGKAVEIRAG